MVIPQRQLMADGAMSSAMCVVNQEGERKFVRNARLHKISLGSLPFPKGFLNLIEDIRPRHPHVRQVSFIKSLEFVARANTVPPIGEHSL
jgi:hypothetical protein